MPTNKVSWNIDFADRALAERCVERIWADTEMRYMYMDKRDALMDLVATHANGCPMDFQKLLDADDFNFMHDISGIQSFLDRETGQLTNHFLPRCSKRRSQ